MHIEVDKNGYVRCILYGCHTDACIEYTGAVPTQPEKYKDIDDWADRAQINAYYLDDKGNLVYDASKVIEEEPISINYCAGESLTPYCWMDGKPIYRYAWSGETSVTNGQAELVTVSFKPETVISLAGAFSSSDGSWYNLTHAYHANSNWNVSAFLRSDGKLIFSVGPSLTGTKKVNIVIEYTK